jgi:threonine dehydrogenase-like Zn-dependent dehydrogenase
VKAVSCLQGELSVVDLPTPRPAAGQLLLGVQRCGICGSDLHARVHADDLDETMKAVGYQDSMRSDTPVVLGHEFCGEVLEAGAKVGKEFKAGTMVVSAAATGRRRCAPDRSVAEGARWIRRTCAGRGVRELCGAQRS